MHAWAFRTRFRRAAFGWKGSKLAIERIHEAIAEVRAVARQDPASSAEGAVLLLERLSPALNQVDSSSGALGKATYAVVLDLVPLIRTAPVDIAVRKRWLDRLFAAIQEDDPPYIESLGDHWGELCATPELASSWADQLLPTLRNVLRERKRGTYAFFPGTTLCYSALFKAGRHDELLELLAMEPRPIWPYMIWGARVLVARGQVDEAIAYARERAGSTTSLETIARFAEDTLLQAGRRGEAFDQYALLANQANSNLSTFSALAKKYQPGTGSRETAGPPRHCDARGTRQVVRHRQNAEAVRSGDRPGLGLALRPQDLDARCARPPDQATRLRPAGGAGGTALDVVGPRL